MSFYKIVNSSKIVMAIMCQFISQSIELQFLGKLVNIKLLRSGVGGQNISFETFLKSN